MSTDPALDLAVAFIAKAEGFRAAPYQDIAGVWTIGYGFTVTEDGQHVKGGTPATTQEAAYARLEGFVGRVLALVRGMVHVPASDHQTAALTSFAYNLGTGALRNSTLLKLLNTGEAVNAAHQFGAWIYAANKPSQGLINRRAAEAAMFLTPDTAEA